MGAVRVYYIVIYNKKTPERMALAKACVFSARYVQQSTQYAQYVIVILIFAVLVPRTPCPCICLHHTRALLICILIPH